MGGWPRADPGTHGGGYEVKTPGFFVPNVLSFATEGKEFRYGAVNQPAEMWLPWSRTTDEALLPGMASVLRSAELLLRPETLLDIIRTYTLYSRKSSTAGGYTTKVIPRYPVEAVIEAFREAGSFLGAARLLTTQGVTPRRRNLTPGGISAGWNPASVAAIVRREVPDAPPPTERGVRAVGARRFSRLLICPHDGSFLTTSPRRNGRTIYVCRQGHHRLPDAGPHPRPYSVSETAVLEWTRVQAGYVMSFTSSTPPDEEAVYSEIGLLLAKRERIAMLFAEGDLTEPVWREKRDEIDRQVESLRGTVRTFLTITGGVPWGGSPAQVNEGLRSICGGIRLGYVGKGSHRRLVPVGAIWKRKPMIDAEDEHGGVAILHPDAVPIEEGWYLPAHS